MVKWLRLVPLPVSLLVLAYLPGFTFCIERVRVARQVGAYL